MPESVIEEVLALKRWVIIAVVFSALSFVVLAGIAIGLKIAISSGGEYVEGKLNQLGQENKQLREENLKLMQQGARRSY